MNRLTSLLAVTLTLLVSFSAAAEDGPGLLDCVQALGRSIVHQTGEFVLEPTQQTLARLAPASLVRNGRPPGLALEPEWQAAPLDKPLVIVVHGFYSNRDRSGRLLSGAAEAGYPIGRFEYASDRPIEVSANLLAEQLRAVADQQPERRISLVTHSMGGIVARAVIEDPELDPGNVTQLVMIAPPNHGSALADLGYGIEPTPDEEELEGRLAARLGRAALAKVIGPAGEQLRTDSAYLDKLNARPRNPAVRYTIFLGTKAPLTAGGFALAQTAAEETDRRWRWTRWVGAAAKSHLAALEELQDGAGDGVVSVASGRLEGVEDVVLLHFHHTEPLWDPDEEAVVQLYDEVLKRLANAGVQPSGCLPEARYP
ncbi:MAG: alpha/beta hydrolase [Planctomycetes bacterium]|nr:alpha/beta hydrolase [Planctomycetota bacterium]